MGERHMERLTKAATILMWSLLPVPWELPHPFLYCFLPEGALVANFRASAVLFRVDPVQLGSGSKEMGNFGNPIGNLLLRMSFFSFLSSKTLSHEEFAFFSFMQQMIGLHFRACTLKFGVPGDLLVMTLCRFLLIDMKS